MKRIFSAAPVTARILRRLGLTGSIYEIAIEKIEICRAESVEEQPAISLPDEIERIERTRYRLTRSELEAAIKGGPTLHGPTIGYRFQNALIADGTVYSGNRYEQVAKQQRRPFLISNRLQFERAQMCADRGADMFFGRWLCDSLAKEILAEEQGLVPLNQHNRLRIHEDGYRQILGMSACRPKLAFARELWIVDDRGYNSNHVRRFRLLRQRLRAALSIQRSGSLFYISRGITGVPGRGIENESEMLSALRTIGFQELCPEEITPAQIATSLLSAKMVIGVEGSSLAHALLALPTGAAIITIQPSNRFSTALKAVSEFAGLRFAFVVAESHGQALRLDVSRLCALIDLVAAS